MNPRAGDAGTARPGPAVHVRVATPADTAFILSLAPRFAEFGLPRGRSRRAITQATRNFIDRALRAGPPTECFLVAEGAGQRAVGFVHLRLERDFFAGTAAAHVANLAVDTPHEGLGVGRALLRAAQRWARTHRCARLTLNVFPGNARARALYDRAGFEPELIRMAKPLARARRGVRAHL